MSFWRRGGDYARLGPVGGVEGDPAVVIMQFEYIPVGEAALTRITAVSAEPLSQEPDIALIVRNGRGAERLELLPDSQIDPNGRLRIAFAAPLELIRKPDATFALQIGHGVVELPEPTPHGRSRRRFERPPADERARLKSYLEEAERDRDAARDVVDLQRAEMEEMRERLSALTDERDEAARRASAAAVEAREARARGESV